MSSGIRNPVAKLRFIRRSLARYQPRIRWIERCPGIAVSGRRLPLARPGRAPPPAERQLARRCGASRRPDARVADGGPPGACRDRAGALSGLTLVAAGVYQLWRSAPVPAAAGGRSRDRSRSGGRGGASRRGRARRHLAGRAGRGVRAVQQRPAHRHQPHDHARAPPVTACSTEDGLLRGRHVRPAGRASCSTRPRATSGRCEAVLQREPAGQLAPAAALRPAQEALPLPDRPLRARLTGWWTRTARPTTPATRSGRTASRVYLNLNHAFLGVSFETRWEGGQALPITQAQFATGRNLTDFLRQRYEIAAGDVRDARADQRQPEEAPDRAPHGLGARLPVRGVRPARPVPEGRRPA